MVKRLLARLRRQRGPAALDLKRTPRDAFLTGYTGRDAEWWVLFVQQRIEVGFRLNPNPADPNHPLFDEGWLRDVLNEALDRTRSPGGDPNIALGAVLAVVFSAWAARIARAKSYDPNRPLDLRRRALYRQAGMVAAIIDAAIDEGQDHLYFPKQKWNPPHGPQAEGGSFV